MTGLAILTGVVAAAVAYLQVAVPLAGPSLARAEVTGYWQVAVIAGFAVLIGAAAVDWLSRRALKRTL